MAPRKRPRPKFLDVLAEHEARISWEQLEATDLDEWLSLSDSTQRELLRRAHEGELNR